MMTAKQTVFREAYRLRIETWYSGPVHVLIIYTIGATALGWFISQINGPITGAQWLVIPLVVFVSNILEWAMHKYIMHRPRKNAIARAIYKRHTQMHHQFFTSQYYTIDTVRDYRIVFFPPYTELAALILAIPGSIFLGEPFGSNAAWLSMSTVVSLYMIYEAFHLCCHVNDNWFVRHMPFVNTIRRHHIAHHHHSIMMDRNMNLTFPIADWLFGTSDLNRGLFGTLFNGYSTRHLREQMPTGARHDKAVNVKGAQSAEALGTVVYSGDRTIEGNVVHRNDADLDAKLAIAHLSDVGMDWGFYGPPSRQLALALLFDHTGNSERALELAPAFAKTVVAHFDNSWEIDSLQIGEAIAGIQR
jgi:hypothetical protein